MKKPMTRARLQSPFLLILLAGMALTGCQPEAGPRKNTTRRAQDDGESRQEQRSQRAFCTTCANTHRVLCIYCNGLGYKSASWFDEKLTRHSCTICNGTGYKLCSH